jgi:tetratricopeptide (TPR) repeat protein
MRVRWGRCWEGGGAPAHWPWIQVIREVVADSDAPPVRLRNLPAEIARILPELSLEVPEPAAHIDAEQARFRLFDAVATLLKESAREQPVVIVLDDLHEADTASLQMLQFTARVLHDANVLIIGTYREAEMRRSTERSPLMDEIVRDALLLPLAGLTEREVGDLVAGRAAGAPATGIVAELHRATAGNPLFVDGVLRALAAEGRLGGGARIDLAGFKLPDGVRGAIRRRLGLLSPDARAVLTTAAVIGQDSDHELLSLVHGHAAEKLAALIGEAEEMGIVGVAGPSSSRFTHPLLREALYDDLGARERTRLHRQVAAALESLHGPNLTPWLAELAHHWRAGAQTSEDIEKAIDYSIRAGDAAVAVFAYEDATGHFRAAVEIEAKQGGNLLRRAGLFDRLSVATNLIDRVDSMRWNEDALGIYEQLGLTDRAARCHTRLGVALTTVGPPRLGSRNVRWSSDPSRAREHFRRAEALLSTGGDTPILARLYCGVAVNSLTRFRINEGLEAGRRAMEIAEHLDRSDLWAAAASAYAWNLTWSGRLGEAVALAERAWQTADREGDRGAAFTATYAGSSVCFGLHDFKEALRWLQRELGKPRAAQSPLRREFIALLMSVSSARLGDLTEARRLSPDSDSRVFHGSMLFLEGKWEEAEELLENEIVELRRVGDLLPASNCALTSASVLRVRGAVRQAALVLGEAVESGGEANVNNEMRIRPLLSRVNAELGQYDAAERELARCREILAAGEDWRGRAADVALAAAVLAAAQGRHRDADGEFAKALSIFCRYTAPWEEADTLECWAIALRAGGDFARADQKFDAAIQVYRRIGAPERWVERVTSMREHAIAATGLRAGETPSSPAPLGLATASDGGGAPRTGEGASVGGNVFRKEGDYWTIAYEAVVFRLKDTKGLHYIAHLLRHPGTEFHANDLVVAAAGLQAGAPSNEEYGPSRQELAAEGLVVSRLGGAPALLDARAKAAYQERLSDLREELADAERLHDLGRAEHAGAEIDFLTTELTAPFRGHQKANPYAERARLTVTKGIKAALERISENHPALGRHLAVTIRRGTFCTYTPDPRHPIPWMF